MLLTMVIFTPFRRCVLNIRRNILKAKLMGIEISQIIKIIFTQILNKIKIIYYTQVDKSKCICFVFLIFNFIAKAKINIRCAP